MNVPSPENASLPSSLALSGGVTVLSDLAAPLVGELNAAWAEGRHILAEEVLGGHPAVAAIPDVAVRVIYEEVCLREGAGEKVPSASVLARFPRWQQELRMLLDCHRAAGWGYLRNGPALACTFPEAGEQLGEFLLLRELGRGAQGRVFLASQPALADRPVVVKLIPLEGMEHLSLARLQHSHIVPLYLVQTFPSHNLRALCMPYLGGLTLAAVLSELGRRPPGHPRQWGDPLARVPRRGQDILDVLAEQGAPPPSLPSRAPVREFLSRASYAQGVCWFGACLADALQYAHERGLVHLDIKPANVLLAADGQPMLLDFHLARDVITPAGASAPAGQPASAGSPSAAAVMPERVGGTAGYMPPEQEAALAAVRNATPVPQPVDGRADIYSLGVTLYEALGGTVPVPPGDAARALRRNPQVSRGLEDIIRKCLRPDPGGRYADAAGLAADLRRHLADLPLRGVPNRSLSERYRKWRRRRRPAMFFILLTFLALGAVLGVRWAGARSAEQRLGEGRTDLEDGQQHLARHQFSAASAVFARGLTRVDGVAGGEELAEALAAHLRRARRGEAGNELHALAEELRLLHGASGVPPAALRQLAPSYQTVWGNRTLLTDRAASLPAELQERLQTDFVDVVVLWVELSVRSAPAGEERAARAAARRALEETEKLAGPDPILRQELRVQARALGQPGPVSRTETTTTRERVARGRSLLRAGEYAKAAAEFDRVLADRPQDFWANYSRGLCHYRLENFRDALTSFHVCVALSPTTAECRYHRALAHAALGQQRLALADYDRALELKPRLAGAALNRGLLHLEAGRYEQAQTDLRKALEDGAPPASVHYNLALVHLARDDVPAALASALRALDHDPTHAGASALASRLRARLAASPAPRTRTTNDER